MNELLEKLVQEAEVSEEAAEKVIEVVKNFLEDKLPGPVAGQVVKYLDGVEADEINDVVDGVKGLFGK